MTRPSQLPTPLADSLKDGCVQWTPRSVLKYTPELPTFGANGQDPVPVAVVPHSGSSISSLDPAISAPVRGSSAMPGSFCLF